MDVNINNLIEIINKLIDNSSRELVGKLCKRIEVLDTNKSLSIPLLKSLNKELIYEESRITKKMLRSILIPSVIFVTNKDKKSE